MMAVFLTLLVALLVLHHQIRGLESAQCSADNASKFQFSVCSRRNATGHRLVKVQVMNEVVHGAVGDAGSELTVDVEYAHSLCNNTEVTITTAQAEAPPVRFRRPDYELFSGLGYYKLHTKVQTWDQARLICMKEGAHLLIVNSVGEAGMVEEFFNRKPIIKGARWEDCIFVGLSDRAVEGEFVTVLGQPLESTGYVKWYSGEPDNEPLCSDPSQDCAGIDKYGDLFVTGCSCKYPFICEQEL